MIFTLDTEEESTKAFIVYDQSEESEIPSSPTERPRGYRVIMVDGELFDWTGPSTYSGASPEPPPL